MNARPGLLVQVALAALAGGLLAALVLAGLRTVDNKPALVLIVLAAVVFCVLAVARRPPPAPPHASAPTRASAPVAPPAQAPRPAAFSWSRTPATGNGYAIPSWNPSAPAAEAPPAPEPSLPVATAAVSVHDGRRVAIPAAGAMRVLQCPRCGDFAVEVVQLAPGLAFGCHRCGHEWRWAPGSSWPVSVVRPGAQHQQARSS
jgi:hypothetical protein